ncbi:hypothetical protein V8J82_14645 [Gymnodinialimonas sp. 2305UL16-5]|uniref:hypothetical protein n=1 Tax=Gymnodinialimonas mytili TaxID=3126503 RepID=UPI0030ADD91C
MRALVLLVCAIAPAASAAGLDCTFTQICSAQTGCQTSDGVPFHFNLSDDTVTFDGPQGPVTGRTLPHLAPPDIAILFDSVPGETLLVTLTGSGEAVMTQHIAAATGGIAAVSYYGTCAPES